MKIIQWNDLHIDVCKFDLTNFSKEDLELFSDCTLVMPGDLTSNWKNLALTFLMEVAEMFQHVVYILGNHEYWSCDIFSDITMRERIEKMKEKGMFPTNVHLLDDRCVEIEGVTFVGGTLWTDLNRGDPIDELISARCMNDYDRIFIEEGGFAMLTPKIWKHMHGETLGFIQKVLSHTPDTEKVVVVTHHAPCSLSIHSDFAGHDSNSSYYSDLSDLILTYSEKFTEGWNWLHGHVHRDFDYTLGTCRVTCNPRGYQSKYLGGEGTGFNALKVIEI